MSTVHPDKPDDDKGRLPHPWATRNGHTRVIALPVLPVQPPAVVTHSTG